MAKKFFYVCAGVLMLAGAYAVGANGVQAQMGGGEIVAMWGSSGTYPEIGVVTNNGDYYSARFVRNIPADDNFYYMGNVFGGVVSSDSQSLDGVKSQYR